MKGLRFLDFDLLFQRTPDGYRAQVLGSPGGQATVEFAPPFSELEIENFLLRFGRMRRPTRRLGSSQIEAARAFGGRLFEAAFAGEVRSCLRSSLDEAHHQDAGLRIRLRLADAPELNDLPWEFLLHPALNRFLALSAETPLVRYLDLPERIRPLAVKPPLKVLAVISSPTDCAPLDVESEWRKLREALEELEERRLLALERLESPTLPRLQRWLRREGCHILHFIGHGGFNPNTEDGLLLFTDDQGRGREVTGHALGTLLHDHRPLRLAVLNACEGARSSRSDPFAGVAQSLVRQGIPAVVAMQFEISDDAAISFAHELYAAVADGYPVDAALAEARKALFFGGHELEWGTPVLYMRSPDGRIFDIEPAATPQPAMQAAPADAKPPSAQAKPASSETKPKPLAGQAAPMKPVAAPTGTAAPPPSNVPPAVAGPPEVKNWPRQPASVPPPAQTTVTAKQHPIVQEPPPVAPRPEPNPKTATPIRSLERSGQASRLPLWIGLIVLLGVAALIASRFFPGNGEVEESAAPTMAEVPAPILEREAGIYLTTAVRAGDLIEVSVLEAVEGEASNSDEPRALQEVLKGCFATDLERGHKLTWHDIGDCP